MRRRRHEAQRARIISVATELACERGAEAVAVSDIVSLARVSRRTFYEHFEDCEECLLAAVESALERAGTRVGAACAEHERWVDRMRAGLRELLALFDEEPGLARLCVVQSAAAGPAVLARRGDVLDQLARMVDRGRGVGGCQPPALTAEGVVGGVFSVLHTRLLEPHTEALPELLGPLMSMVVLPYLGDAAACRELARSSRPGPQFPRVRLSRGRSRASTSV